MSASPVKQNAVDNYLRLAAVKGDDGEPLVPAAVKGQRKELLAKLQSIKEQYPEIAATARAADTRGHCG